MAKIVHLHANIEKQLKKTTEVCHDFFYFIIIQFIVKMVNL